jgi:Relaxase/Mobilisation nuclease domain
MGDLKLGIFDTATFSSVLEPPTRPKRNRARPIWQLGQGSGAATGSPTARPAPTHRSRLETVKAIAKRSPEVMVKVTGTNHEGGALQAHLGYLQRKDEAAIEDERGTVLEASTEAMREVMQRWGVAVEEGEDNRLHREAREIEGQARKHDSRKTIAVHIVLSMPKGTDAAIVLDAARGFASEELEHHQHLLVLHTDREHPHVHIVVNNTGDDLRRLSHKRADLQRWREVFARELRQRGVDANATPRKARGVVKKGEKTVIRQAKTRMAREKKAKPGAVRKKPLRVFTESVEEAVNHARGLVAHEMTEAERRARENRVLLDEGFKDAVKSLQQQGEEGSEVAAQLAQYMQTMPAPTTARDELIKDVKTAVVDKGKDASRPTTPSR